MNNLTVCGGGILGGQIAWQSAYFGKQVAVYDVTDEALDNCRAAHKSLWQVYQDEAGASPDSVAAAQARLSYTTDLAEAVVSADIVIEAIPEIPDIKTKFYTGLAQVLPEQAIIATNSSTLLPGMFADATGRPEKYCSLHFANRIWDLNVAEVMAHASTSEATLTTVTRFAIEIGMVPVPIQKEQNGYVLNSLLIPLLNAAQSLVTNGVSDPETIDRTWMITNRGLKNGPFGSIDFIGMNTMYNIFSYWGNENNDAQMLANAEYVKANFLDKGRLGVQTGQGYYSYPDASFLQEGFLDVPELDQAEAIARLTFPNKN